MGGGWRNVCDKKRQDLIPQCPILPDEIRAVDLQCAHICTRDHRRPRHRYQRSVRVSPLRSLIVRAALAARSSSGLRVAGLRFIWSRSVLSVGSVCGHSCWFARCLCAVWGPHMCRSAPPRAALYTDLESVWKCVGGSLGAKTNTSGRSCWSARCFCAVWGPHMCRSAAPCIAL